MATRRNILHGAVAGAAGILAGGVLLPTGAQAVAWGTSREEILWAAERWYQIEVPYSMNATFEGYRTDCSGYVSMAWETSRPGYLVSGLTQVSSGKSMASLEPGDILLSVTSNGGHVFLFKNWEGPALGAFYAYDHYSDGLPPRLARWEFSDPSWSAYEARQYHYLDAEQSGWRWCRKCQNLVYAPNGVSGHCAQDGRPHDGTQSFNYYLRYEELPTETEMLQPNWRYCNRCESLVYHAGGPCSRGGPHYLGASFDYKLWHDPWFNPGERFQTSWRYCGACLALYYGPGQADSNCPGTNGPHTAPGSFDYWLWHTNAYL